MLNEEEKRFIAYWEEVSGRKNSLMIRKMLPGFMWGFVLGCATILPPFALMKKKNLEITPGILLIFFFSILLIGIFVGYLRWKIYLEKNEELYRQLKLRMH